MAISKQTFLRSLSDIKACLDSIYCRTEDLGTILVSVSSSQPDTSAHWIKPVSLMGDMEAKRLIVSQAQPDTQNTIWIKADT